MAVNGAVSGWEAAASGGDPPLSAFSDPFHITL